MCVHPSPNLTLTLTLTTCVQCFSNHQTVCSAPCSSRARCALTCSRAAPCCAQEVLELRRAEATAAAVRSAYKRLALALHPDRNHARQAEAAFKRLQDAYEALRGSSGGGGGSGGSGGSGGCGSGGCSSGGCGATGGGGSGGGKKGPEAGFFTCRNCGEETRDGEDGRCDDCLDDLTCPGCGEEKDDEYEEFCSGCQEDLEEEQEAARQEAWRQKYFSGSTYRRAASCESDSRRTLCSDCGRSFTPPPSYMGNYPVCRACF